MIPSPTVPSLQNISISSQAGSSDLWTGKNEAGKTSILLFLFLSVSATAILLPKPNASLYEQRRGKVRPLATKTLFNLINWISQASSLLLENEAVWKWMELENTRLSEQVPTRKSRPQMFSVLCGPWLLSLTGSCFWWERVWRGQKVTGAAMRRKEALGRWARRATGPMWQERTERYWRAGVTWGWKHGDGEATENKYVWKCYKRR